MATVTCYTRATEPSSYDQSATVVLESNRPFVYETPAAAESNDFTLPNGAPVGFSTTIHNVSGQEAVLTAPADSSMDGAVTTLADNESAVVTKSTNDTWVATIFAVADV